MENDIINYEWDGSSISFNLSGNGTMINATEMAKAFGKRPVDWLRFDQSKNFIKVLSKVRNHTLEELVYVVKGGNHPGTWMHEDVAIEFARWLNPLFGIWCNDKVKELMINGYSVIGNTREDFERAYQEIQGRLSQVEQENCQIKQENYQLKQSLDTQRAAEAFCNTVFQGSENLYTMTDIVKGLGFSIGRVEMYNKLEELGYMFRHSKIWRLKDPWSKQGYTKDILVQGKDGKYHNVMRWTDPGRAFVFTI